VERIDWTGHRNAAGELVRLGATAQTGDDQEEADAMVAACAEEPRGTGALADAEGVTLNRTGDRYRRLLRELEEHGRLVQREGLWHAA
jgi:hypothetical protein